ncbi:methionine--tRNA ligase [Candidatus Woesearchaeota archaeon CG10_big_fil_rev_8_21_14_0_10_32_24]|nr:MAG: methionine--tRNA ligase [Candidatus Woesearchaeota archaeon CG10_big_fil_rev_8_21_14_0_10_32_24]
MVKSIVTCALPYANGKLHIGHMLEHIQGDIYARFLRLIGKDVLFIGGADMHGTPVELNAAKAGIDVEVFAEAYRKEFVKNFKDYLIEYDNFYKTHSTENKEFAEFFFKTLKEKGFVKIKAMEQMYDEKAQRFLPDRYVKGTCPKCNAEDQYGDICESCGTIYNPIDLINPYSVITQTKPVLKTSKHYFIELSKFGSQLKEWIDQSNFQPEIINWLQNWMHEGLEDWCISRDEPYFGFEIPGSEKETGSKKFFYVWLDAPIGYISSTKNYTDKHNLNWEDYWKGGEITHILGKDIVYFHYLFWPAMLMAVGFSLPKVQTHGFITVNGKKMSKSRGTFFTADDFIKLYDAESLRFYYASHLDQKVVDINLDFKDFQAVINNVLMGNLGNFCYRTLVFAQKNYLTIETVAHEEELEKEITTLIAEIKEHYNSFDFKSAVQKILRISDIGNQYFQKAQPWSDKDAEESKAAVGFCVNLVRTLSILVQPIVPILSKKVQSTLSEEKLMWKDISFNWNGMLQIPEQLVQKIESLPVSNDFPIHMKVGEIIEVKDHPDADKLYVMQVNFGSERKQIVAGLKKHFTPEQLVGINAVFCVNLKPAKLRGELSQGMSMIAEDDEGNLSWLNPSEDIEIGQEVQFEGLKNAEKEITFDEFVKIKLVAKGGKIFYDGKELQKITVSGVKDGATVR